MATPEVPPPPTEQQETALVLVCDWSRTRRPQCLVVNVVSVLHFHPNPTPQRGAHIFSILHGNAKLPLEGRWEIES